MNRTLFSGFLALGLSAVPVSASAFCRSTTCTQNCSIDQATGCPVTGKYIAWTGPCLSYSVSRDESSSITHDQLKEVTNLAFKAWQEATCVLLNKPPSISVDDAFGDVTCNRVEYNAHQANANLIVMRDTWEGDKSVLALTTVTTNTETGEIYDADMEINGTQPLSIGSVSIGKYDLQSIVTHEAGHFLGLAHSNVAGATMSPSYMSGTNEFASLEADDIAGICSIYPSARPAPACDPTPRRGFSSECGLDPANGGSCSVAMTRERSSRGAVTAFFVGLGVAMARSRGRRRVRS